MDLIIFDEFIPISIHAPREGGDAIPCPRWAAKPSFQSTPPARGATVTAILNSGIPVISIHAPREGGDLTMMSTMDSLRHFNPRPPRGGRLPDVLRDVGVVEFQSTPPARGATASSTAHGIST